jgi:hypothetical protein
MCNKKSKRLERKTKMSILSKHRPKWCKNGFRTVNWVYIAEVDD